MNNAPKISKTFQKDGHWIEKPSRTEILVCTSCKSKYIKTRATQDVCLRCLGRRVPAGKSK